MTDAGTLPPVDTVPDAPPSPAASLPPGPSSPHPDAGPAPHPVSTYCGDGIRDPILEECDDGLGNPLGPCTADCRVRDLGALPAEPPDVVLSPTFQRLLGAGPHVAAAQDDGFAVVYTERDGQSVVYLAEYDRWGNALGAPVEASRHGIASDPPQPVVAALPGGRYAVAWTDRRTGTPDVSLQVVTPGEEPSDLPIYAHAGTTGAQQDADMLWVDGALLVVWSDGFDLKQRRFAADLTPLGAESALTATSALESSATLASFAEGWAAAWRSGEEGMERIRVRAGETRWHTPLHAPGSAGERPLLVQLDARHLLLVYSVNTDPTGSGVSNVGRLRLALLDVQAPGLVTPWLWTPLREPYASDARLGQRRPSLTRVGERVYLAWETQSPQDDPLRREVFFTELSWSAEDGLVQYEERPLQIEAPRLGDQRNPRLAASPLFPEGALITLWEDHSRLLEGRPTPDVLMALRPSPLVELAPVISGD